MSTPSPEALEKARDLHGDQDARHYYSMLPCQGLKCEECIRLATALDEFAVKPNNALRDACGDIAWLIFILEGGHTLTTSQLVQVRGRLASYRRTAGFLQPAGSVPMGKAKGA